MSSSSSSRGAYFFSHMSQVAEAARPEAKLCIPGHDPKKSSSSHPCGMVPQAKAFATSRPSSSETRWCRVHRNSRLDQSRTSASAGIATPYASTLTFRAALPAGVPTAPRRSYVAFAHAMSWTSPSTSSMGTTYLATTSSGIGVRSKDCARALAGSSWLCFWLLAFGRAARFSGRRAGFAEGLALGLTVLFVLRGGIVSTGGAARVRI
mmetsp:Transcript_2464/g.5829  ORF Transcript_2464/g.5829 Transcript_2464/m.5829 type:complete len:208 (+) Transcript_2464:809-1432(+)